MFIKVLNQIEQTYNVIQKGAQSVVFESNDKLFAVCEGFETLTIYRCYCNRGEIVFLPGSKQGKSFKTVSGFVAARISQ